MTPTLSVIIPTYNRADLLSHSIRSALGCGVEDVEVIVVDDGSTDATAEVMRQFTGQVIYTRQENAGPSTARNRGFQRSRGRYVAFLDSDDSWLPSPAASMVQLLDDHPEVDVIIADCLMSSATRGPHSQVAAAGRGWFDRVPAREPQPGFRILDARAYFRGLLRQNLVNVGAHVMRRAAFEAAGGFDGELAHNEDWALSLRLARRCTFGFWNEVLLVWRDHPGARLSADEHRMVGGAVRALRKAAEACAPLTWEERAQVGTTVRDLLFSHAYKAYECGEYATAARGFSDLLAQGRWRLRPLCYRLACALPPRVVGGLRRLKHRWA